MSELTFSGVVLEKTNRDTDYDGEHHHRQKTYGKNRENMKWHDNHVWLIGRGDYGA